MYFLSISVYSLLMIFYFYIIHSEFSWMILRIPHFKKEQNKTSGSSSLYILKIYTVSILGTTHLLWDFKIFPFPHLSIDSISLFLFFSFFIHHQMRSHQCLSKYLSSWMPILRFTPGKQHNKQSPLFHFSCWAAFHHMQLYTELNYILTPLLDSLVLWITGVC